MFNVCSHLVKIESQAKIIKKIVIVKVRIYYLNYFRITVALIKKEKKGKIWHIIRVCATRLSLALSRSSPNPAK